MRIRDGPKTVFLFCKNAMKGVISIGTDFTADIHCCVADHTGIYRMAAEKTEKGPGRKRQRNHVITPGAADRVS